MRPAPAPHLIAIKNSGTIPGSNGIMNPGENDFMTAIKGLVALALALPAFFCAADTVYKYQRPDGSIVYSDKPVRDARLVGRYELVPPPARSAEHAASGAGKDPDEVARTRSQALDAADAGIKAAERALARAQERQQAGVEPLPGERVGNAAGRGARLGLEYFARQKQLANEVESAQARLDEAYRLRNDLRD